MVVFFDPVSIMERERSSFKDGAMKLKLYVLSTAFDQSPVNSLSCSTVLVRALNSPCIRPKTGHDTEQQIFCQSIA